jgi:hypothetical protein
MLIDLFPIVKAEEHVPDWYRKLPGKPGQDIKNVRQCPAAKDLFTKGMLIPMWADYEITIDSDGSGSIDSGMTLNNIKPAEVHNLGVQAHGAWPGYSNVKFASPWYIWCSEPIEWAWTQPIWWQNNPKEFITVTGISEFRYQHECNINCLIKKPESSIILNVRAGTPMAHLIPLTDREWDLKLDVLTPEVYAKKFSKWNHSLKWTSPAMAYQQLKSIINRN